MTDQEKETLQLYRRIQVLERALQSIVEWKIPDVWDTKEERYVSFTYLHGSNGARDYFRDIAKHALDKSNELK